MEAISLAIDIGGTKTAFGFITEDGKIIYETSISTGKSSDPNELIGRLKVNADEAFDKFNSKQAWRLPMFWHSGQKPTNAM